MQYSCKITLILYLVVLCSVVQNGATFSLLLYITSLLRSIPNTCLHCDSLYFSIVAIYFTNPIYFSSYQFAITWKKPNIRFKVVCWSDFNFNFLQLMVGRPNGTIFSFTILCCFLHNYLIDHYKLLVRITAWFLTSPTYNLC